MQTQGKPGEVIPDGNNPNANRAVHHGLVPDWAGIAEVS